jgi:hypothetical protein
MEDNSYRAAPYAYAPCVADLIRALEVGVITKPLQERTFIIDIDFGSEWAGVRGWLRIGACVETVEEVVAAGASAVCANNNIIVLDSRYVIVMGRFEVDCFKMITCVNGAGAGARIRCSM